jgi:excisionase family DNA binding protein
MTTATHETIWLTTAEAAKLMQISEGTLHNWRSSKRHGRPKAHRLGRHVKYAQSEILRWIDAQQERVK